MPMYHPFLSFIKVIRLPEYEYIGVTEEELKIIDSYEFQRLRRIKQTPGAYIVYPGASHTRFEHSLGVMYLAGEAAAYALLNTYCKPIKATLPIIKVVNVTAHLDKASQWGISLTDKSDFGDIIQKVRLAGLLHDIGHGPFSHTFELFHVLCGSNWDHEKASKEIIKSLIDNINSTYSPEEIIRILEGKEKFLSDILVSEAYNFDRMNYLVLDSKRAGTLEYGAIDVCRVIQNLYINDEGHLCIGSKAKEATIRTLEAYSYMYHNVYLHKKARGADIQIAHILKYSYKNDNFDIFEPDINKLLLMWDDGIVYELYKLYKEKRIANTTKDFLLRYLKRDILKCVFRKPLEDVNVNRILARGSEQICNEIKQVANLTDNDFIYIDYTSIKPPAPAPTTLEKFKRISFYDPIEGANKLETHDIDRLNKILRRIIELRVYCFKEVEDKVKEALKKLMNSDEITL